MIEVSYTAASGKKISPRNSIGSRATRLRGRERSGPVNRQVSNKWHRKPGVRIAALLAAAYVLGVLAMPEPAKAQQCARTITATVVTLDQPLMFNRLGAQNVNGMIFALKRDVILSRPVGGFAALTPISGTGLSPSDLRGNVLLRLDKRPRPLVLRVAAGDCLQVTFDNLLSPTANPNDNLAADPVLEIDEQAATRYAGFHAQGMQLVNGIGDDASFVGRNASSLVPSGSTATYKLFAEHEGTFLVTSDAPTFGSEGSQGNAANGLFGAINVEPKGAAFYRSQVTEEELRLATTGQTSDGHPVIDYEAKYPSSEPWIAEGKAGLPILNMLNGTELVHSDLNAAIAYGGSTGKITANGLFPQSTYPLESTGVRNPTVPTRLEPFREYTVIFHDEVAAAQMLPNFYVNDPVFKYVLAGVKDGFMINYGSGGIGSEILANRIGVGPMHDCLS